MAPENAPNTPPGMVVMVRFERGLKGAPGKLRRVLAQLPAGTHAVVIDDGSGDDALRERLSRLPSENESERVRVVCHDAPRGFAACLNAVAAGAPGCDVLALEPGVRVFSGFTRAFSEASLADARTGIWCPLSERSRRALLADWQSGLAVPPQVPPKRWAKLIRKTAPRERPELRAANPECVLVKRKALDAVGPLAEGELGAKAALDAYSARVRAAGLQVRLLDDVFVDASSGRIARSSSPPVLGPVAAATENALQGGGASPLAEQLAWHVRRGTADNFVAPLILLGSSPSFDARLEQATFLEQLLRALALPRAVLAYPTARGLELMELVDGEWSAPLVYRRALEQPLTRFPGDVTEARAALSELCELFQIGWLHVHDSQLWAPIVSRLPGEETLPYCLTIDDEDLALIDEHAELFEGARRIFSASETALAALSERCAIKPKRLKLLGGRAIEVVCRAYAGCARHAPRARARWLSRSQLQRLAALRVLPGAPALGQRSRKPLQSRRANVLEAVRSRVPEALRSLAERLPYGRKNR